MKRKGDGNPYSREGRLLFRWFYKRPKETNTCYYKGSTDEEIAGSLLRKFMTIPVRKRRNAKDIYRFRITWNQ